MKHYTLIIFTASDQLYADSVLSHIDPMWSYFKYRMYRTSCFKAPSENGSLYVKDLRVIRNVPLSNMIIVDNSVLSFAFQLDNGIPILPFYSNKDDIEMSFLKNYLVKLSKYDDVKEQNSLTFNLHQVLKEAVLGSPEQSQSTQNLSCVNNERKVSSQETIRPSLFNEKRNAFNDKTTFINQNTQKKVNKINKTPPTSNTQNVSNNIISSFVPPERNPDLDFSFSEKKRVTEEDEMKKANILRRKSRVQVHLFETMEKARKMK